mmetsp:Transcript_81187/g.238550  ORF Transcript_81187/g.238550 Transcript_81187/m.238550 type:complete len:222 (-) Transcript_81187:803-1468(-)
MMWPCVTWRLNWNAGSMRLSTPKLSSGGNARPGKSRHYNSRKSTPRWSRSENICTSAWLRVRKSTSEQVRPLWSNSCRMLRCRKGSVSYSALMACCWRCCKRRWQSCAAQHRKGMCWRESLPAKPRNVPTQRQGSRRALQKPKRLPLLRPLRGRPCLRSCSKRPSLKRLCPQRSRQSANEARACGQRWRPLRRRCRQSAIEARACGQRWRPPRRAHRWRPR